MLKILTKFATVFFFHERLTSFFKQDGVNFDNDRPSVVSCRIRFDRMAIVRCRSIFLGFDWLRRHSFVTLTNKLNLNCTIAIYLLFMRSRYNYCACAVDTIIIKTILIIATLMVLCIHV